MSHLNKVDYASGIIYDCFKLATFLDPRMGWKMFDEKKRVEIRERLKYHMCLIKPNKSFIKSNTDKNETNINSLYCTYDTSINSKTDDLDDYDEEIDKYATLIASANYKDPLLFWKKYEYLFPTLAPLAKKFLGVPASSASVERMFNISGHIFSNKRRRTGVTLFENLVFIKLNESYLKYL